MDYDNRHRFFDEGQQHPADCDCQPGDHPVRYHDGVCYIGNVGVWVSERVLKGLQLPGRDRMRRLAGLWTKEELAAETRRILEARIQALADWSPPRDPTPERVEDVMKQREAEAEAHRRWLRISACRPWCKWYGSGHDHSWCETPDHVKEMRRVQREFYWQGGVDANGSPVDGEPL